MPASDAGLSNTLSGLEHVPLTIHKGSALPKVTYVQADGAATVVESSAGISVMAVAVANAIDGIVAECGGNLMCATCHVYVEPGQVERLPPVADDEDEMLDSTESERTAYSRLGCQLELTADLDGLVVHVPERQTP
jgi:2Fe-2S ferredoxin